MIKEFSDLWNLKSKDLEQKIKNTDRHDLDEYEKLFKIMLDVFEYKYYDLHIIDDGSYSGTLVFIFTNSDYEPYIENYLFSYIDYGSCSVCDALCSAFAYKSNDNIDYSSIMNICLTMLQNINYFTKGRE